MSRRPPEDRGAVITWHKQGLAPAEICRKTGFDHHFVKRWITKETDLAHLTMPSVLGGQGSFRRVWSRLWKEKCGGRRRSSRVIARELKRQKVCDVSYKTVQRAVHRRGLHAFKQQQ